MPPSMDGPTKNGQFGCVCLSLHLEPSSGGGSEQIKASLQEITQNNDLDCDVAGGKNHRSVFTPIPRCNARESPRATNLTGPKAEETCIIGKKLN